MNEYIPSYQLIDIAGVEVNMTMACQQGEKNNSKILFTLKHREPFGLDKIVNASLTIKQVRHLIEIFYSDKMNVMGDGQKDIVELDSVKNKIVYIKKMQGYSISRTPQSLYYLFVIRHPERMEGITAVLSEKSINDFFYHMKQFCFQMEAEMNIKRM